MKDIEKRIDKIEGSMHPTNGFLLVLAQLMSVDSARDCAISLGERDDDVWAPANRTLSALRKQLEFQGLSRDLISDKLREASFETVFRAHLWRNCNEHVGEQAEGVLPRLQRLLRRAEQQSNSLVKFGAGVPLDFADDAKDLLADFLVTRSAIETIRAQYFEGHPILFKDYDHKLGVGIDEAEVLIKAYNKLVDSRDEIKSGQDLPSRVDVDQVKADATNASKTLVRSLVRLAESRARAALGDTKRAAQILIDELK